MQDKRMARKHVATRAVFALAFAAALAAAAGNGDPLRSPAYFWMWNGRLDADALCAQLEDMHAHGLRNVCIHPFPKGFRTWFPTDMDPDYLTDAYLDVFAKVVRRAGELGMHAYLYDEGGWPSGGACGRVVASDPKESFTRREITCAKDGRLEVRTRPFPKGPAKYPSVIERGTTQRFIDLTHEAYAKRLGGDIGSTMRIAFTDEPDMARDVPGRSLAWTADFAEEFARRKGYDLLPHVPALIADQARTNAALAQVRIDVMDVRADLFVERYLAPLRDWCRAHGMICPAAISTTTTRPSLPSTADTAASCEASGRWTCRAWT